GGGGVVWLGSRFAGPGVRLFLPGRGPPAGGGRPAAGLGGSPAVWEKKTPPPLTASAPRGPPALWTRPDTPRDQGDCLHLAGALSRMQSLDKCHGHWRRRAVHPPIRQASRNPLTEALCQGCL